MVRTLEYDNDISCDDISLSEKCSNISFDDISESDIFSTSDNELEQSDSNYSDDLIESNSEVLYDDVIDNMGERIFYKIENNIKNTMEWYKINFNENWDKFYCHYNANYCEYVIDFLKELKLSYHDIVEYNKFWWCKSELSGNIFTSGYTKNEIIKDNPYYELYKKINSCAITLNSQMHMEGELKIQENPFGKDDNEVIDIPSKIIQRPYIDILCTIDQAKIIMDIGGPHLYIGYVSLSDKKWELNYNFLEDYEYEGIYVGITKLYYPSIRKISGITHTYFGGDNNDHNCSDSCLDIFRNKDIMANVSIVYKHWNCNNHDDPMKYMLGKIIESLDCDSFTSDSINNSKSDIIVSNFTKNNILGKYVYTKLLDDFKNKELWFYDFYNSSLYENDELCRSYNLGYELYSFHWVKSLNLSYFDLLECNKLWWNTLGKSYNPNDKKSYKNLPPYSINFFNDYRYDVIMNTPYKDKHIKLNNYTIVRKYQKYFEDITSPYQKDNIKGEFEVENLNDIVIQIIQVPYLKIICTTKLASRLCKLDNKNLGIGYLSFPEKKWYFNSTCEKYFDINRSIPIEKYFAQSIYEEVNSKYIFHGVEAYTDDKIKNKFHRKNFDIFNKSEKLADLFVIYRYWDCSVHSDPTSYMYDRIIECLEK